MFDVYCAEDHLEELIVTSSKVIRIAGSFLLYLLIATAVHAVCAPGYEPGGPAGAYCVVHCAPGYDRRGDRCISMSCPPGQYWSGNGCHKQVSCPAGMHVVNGSICKADVHCAVGSHAIDKDHCAKD